MQPVRRDLLILGAGSFAAEVANLAGESGWRVAGFVDTRLPDKETGELEGMPVWSPATAERWCPTHLLLCALGTTQRGREIARMADLGFAFATLVHPSAIIPASVHLDAGAIIGPGVIVGHASDIGDHAVINRGAMIGHHTIIGACVTVSPGANIAARVSIGRRCYIGMGALVLDGRRVGEGCVVGAGAVVTKDVPEGVQVIGLPARIVKTGVDGL